MKIFQFMTFHTKVQRTQNHCVLGLIKQVDLLRFMMINFDIYYYLILNCLIQFVIRLNIL